MRIQHNIMAMNAYRNYNNNTSALAKNLEKLSSGYRINRAGDDAAGLAISEKMRAQITALGTAQKNVKDGISLVKTAEGATQEIHDMLNRMVDLAEQSANGTYQDKVDREAIQEEYNALKKEINRIADASNFNGIKLLDGSLDSDGKVAAKAGTVSSIVTSTVGQTLGTSTILHQGGVEAAETEFGVDLHELKFSNATGDTLTLKIGNNTFTLAGNDGGEMDAAAIASAFENGDFKIADGVTAVDATAVELTDGTNTGNFTAKADGNRIVFTQAEGEDPVDGDMTVSVTGPGAAAIAAGTVTGAIADADVDATVPPNNGATAKYTYDFSGITALTAGGYTVGIAGKSIDVTLTDAAHTLGDLLTAVETELAKTANQIDDGKGTKYTAAVTGNTIVFTAGTPGDGTSVNTAITGTISVTGKATPAGASSVTGDYNTTTTVTQQGAKEAPGRIASGVATFTKAQFADGNVIKVGDKSYTVSTNAADKNDTTKVYVGDLNLDDAAGLKTAIDRLSVAADSNSVWTIGHGATAGQVTFVEKVNDAGKSYTDLNSTNGKLNDGAFDLSKEAVIKETFGTVTGASEEKAGKALVLQIGEDSEEYNQLSVNIADMHTSSLGLDAVNLDTQTNAQEAVKVIKDAINQVSTTRGRLGATQNRLEHTSNNLSTMKENIQDAEATIRDTDIAEEMMAYTKNNILVQSAQAMLAQANQIPQGVLQLLG